MTDAKPRCAWCTDDPLYIEYHDTEWGVPCRDDRRLFEFLILEGAQAGLSWITVLRKRENYRRALFDFDPERVATLSDKDLERLRQDPGLIRNRLKLESARRNARAFLEIQGDQGRFADFIWGFVDGTPIVNRFGHIGEVPARTHVSDAMSKELKRLGFNFVGSTICYAYMQATGMVMDHTSDCFRYRQLARPQTP